MLRWHRAQTDLATLLPQWCEQATRIFAFVPASVLAHHENRLHDLLPLCHRATHRVYLAGPNAADVLRARPLASSYRLLPQVLTEGATDVVMFEGSNAVRIVHGALFALRAGPEARLLNVIEVLAAPLTHEAIAGEAFFDDLARRGVVPSRAQLAPLVIEGEELVVQPLDSVELPGAVTALRHVIGEHGERRVFGPVGRVFDLSLDSDGVFSLSESHGGLSATKRVRHAFTLDDWTLARSSASGGLVLCSGGQALGDGGRGVSAIALGAVDDPALPSRIVDALSQIVRRAPEPAAAARARTPSPPAVTRDTSSAPRTLAAGAPTREVDGFTSLSLEQRIVLAHEALLGAGEVASEEAVRGVAELLREQGMVTFQRLHGTSPLALGIEEALRAGVKAGLFDRPRRGRLRAVVAELDAAVARDCVVRAVREGCSEREDVFRRAHDIAREVYGLQSVHMRKNGKVWEAIKSAVNSALRRGLVVRAGDLLVAGGEGT
jgi:hypothetical protein